MEYEVYYDGGILHCPGCGRLLGSFAEATLRMKDQCGATVIIFAKKETP